MHTTESSVKHKQYTIYLIFLVFASSFYTFNLCDYAHAANFSLSLEGNEVPPDRLQRDRNNNLYISVSNYCEIASLIFSYDEKKFVITIIKDDRKLAIKLRSSNKNRALLSSDYGFRSIDLPIITHSGDVFIPIELVSKWLGIALEYRRKPQRIIKTKQRVPKPKPESTQTPAEFTPPTSHTPQQIQKPQQQVQKDDLQKHSPGFNISSHLYQPKSVFGDEDRPGTKPMFGASLNYKFDSAFSLEFRFSQWSDHYSWHDNDFSNYWDNLKITYDEAVWPDYKLSYQEINVWPFYIHFIYRIGSEFYKKTGQRGFPYVGLGYGYYRTQIITDHEGADGFNSLGHSIHDYFTAPHFVAGFEYDYSQNLSFKFDLLYHFANRDFSIKSVDLTGGSNVSDITPDDKEAVINEYVDEFNNSDTRLDLRGFAYGLSFTFRY